MKTASNTIQIWGFGIVYTGFLFAKMSFKSKDINNTKDNT